MEQRDDLGQGPGLPLHPPQGYSVLERGKHMRSQFALRRDRVLVQVHLDGFINFRSIAPFGVPRIDPGYI